MNDDKPDPQIERTDAPASIGHNSGMNLATSPTNNTKSGPISVSVDKVVVWSAAAAQAADMQQFEMDQEVEVLKTSGQRMPVIVRRSADDRFEAIGRAHLVHVVKEHNRRFPTASMDIDIHIMRLDDSAAFRLAAQELEPGTTVSSYARGCFFAQALERHRTEQDTALRCRVAKSTVSKNLDVYRAVSCLPRGLSGLACGPTIVLRDRRPAHKQGSSQRGPAVPEQAADLPHLPSRSKMPH